MAQTNASSKQTTRRSFLRVTTTAATALAASSVLATSGCIDATKRRSARACPGLLQKGGVVLFQGDSITDAGRDRGREGNANDARAMGASYVFLAGTQLLADCPELGLRIYNRGISGNKVFQLADRWDTDCISLRPDVVSILIGVNDIWHTLNGAYKGTVEIYERDYRALLERTQRELPQARLVICEPFVLRCGAVKDTWFPEFDRYRDAAGRIAADFGAVFVPFQSMFDQAVRHAPPAYWAADGVHPSLAGAHRMAQAWLDAVATWR